MGGVRVTLATSERIATRVREVGRALDVEVVCLDPLTAEAIAELRDTARVIVAVVSGKEAAEAALSADVDDVLEEQHLSAETLARSVRVASMRASRRRDEGAHGAPHRERLAAVGAVAAGVAHEISSPASAVVVHLELLRAEVEETHGHVDGDHLRQVLDDTLASMRVVLDLVRDLQTLGRTDGDPAPEVVDVRALVRQVLRLTVPRDLLVEIDDPNDVPLLWVPRTRLMQIVTNLVSNAVHAMREHPRPVHRLRVSIRLDDTSLMLAIADTGGGIHPHDLARVFDPYFTTRDARGGTGLGLPLSRQIVRELGGDLTLDSTVGEGTIAMVFLPLALRSRIPPDRASPESRGGLPRRPRVLVVEPAAAELQALEKLLSPYFELLSARSGVEALDVISSGARVELMVYDRALRAGDTPLHQIIARHAPGLLRRTVLLGAEAAADESAPAVTVPRAAIEDELVAALERLDVDSDVGALADRPLIS